MLKLFCQLRKKRQADEEKEIESEFKEETTLSYKIEEITTPKSNDANEENGVTLSEARRQPKVCYCGQTPVMA